MTDPLDKSLAAPEGDPSPLPPPPGALPMEQQLAALQAQVTALTSLLGGALQNAFKGGVKFDDPTASQPLPEPPTRPKDERRVRIILEDNDQIPPGGQFIGVDGTPYLMQANVEVEAPIGILDVLDNAIMSVPVLDGDMSVVGYRDRLRFPYRVVRRDRDNRDQAVQETAEA